MFLQTGGEEREVRTLRHTTQNGEVWGGGIPCPPLLLSNLEKGHPASPPDLGQLSEMSPDKGPGASSLNSFVPEPIPLEKGHTSLAPFNFRGGEVKAQSGKHVQL